MSSQQLQSQTMQWNQQQWKKVRVKGPSYFVSCTILFFAILASFYLYTLLSNWIVLEMKLGLVSWQLYKPLRTILIISALVVFGLILFGQGLNILVTSYRHRQAQYDLKQSEKYKNGNQKKELNYQQDLLRMTSTAGPSSRRTTPITPPLNTPSTRDYSYYRYMSGFESDSVLRNNMSTKLEFSSSQSQQQPYLGATNVEPFSIVPQNQQSPRRYNGQQSILGQPVDYFQQQRSIDKYYPSVQMISGSTAAARDTSPPQIVNQVLLKLKLDERVLEVWTDRLRQWLASQVVKPLVQQINTAHIDANEKSAQLGLNVNLPPLDSEITPQQNHHHHQRSPNQQNGLQTAILLREQLQHTLNQLQKQNTGQLFTPQNNQQKEQQIKMLEDCVRVVTRYVYLCQLLRGQFIKSDMLLGSSRYMVNRIKQLAQDSCIGNYIWNGGGNFGGQTWNSSLPTDTALIFYLLTAFLKAPNWIWPDDDSQSNSNSNYGPLFLGEIPVRAPERFTAIVTNKPGLLSKQATVMTALLQPQYPQFSLIFEGQEVCTVSGHQGLFQCFLMLLQYTQQQLGGKLGGHSLELYGLQKVIAPVEPNFSVLQKNWFGLW